MQPEFTLNCGIINYWDTVLAAHLRWIVRSKISNLVTSTGNTREVRVEDLSIDDEPGTEHQESWAWDFLASLASEPRLELIANTIMDGVTRRQDLAEHLGMKPEQVTNARKQLQRRLNNYLEIQNSRI